MNKEDLIKKDHEVYNGLKNFQQATVKRIDKLFRQGRRRILVADEVGLGKTIIARGCIAKTAVLVAEERLKEAEDRPYKVVYVCSNQNIARKNIGKLDIYKGTKKEDKEDSKNQDTGKGPKKKNDKEKDIRISDIRLSMQHLINAELERDYKGKMDVQFLSLTPQTSFFIRGGQGTLGERALMFLILRELPQFKGNEELKKVLYDRMRGKKKGEQEYKGWHKYIDHYERRLNVFKDSTTKEFPENGYPEYILKEIQSKYGEIIEELVDVVSSGQEISSELMNSLRTMFAKISVQQLKPDLVIMDEFQRFKFMLDEIKNDPNDTNGNQGEFEEIALGKDLDFRDFRENICMLENQPELKDGENNENCLASLKYSTTDTPDIEITDLTDQVYEDNGMEQADQNDNAVKAKNNGRKDRNKESELSVIADEFLNKSNPRVLLLSATPYKLLSTTQDIEMNPKEDAYKEFIQVMHFLFKDEQERQNFDRVWEKYSNTLTKISTNGIEPVKEYKNEAEAVLFRGMCRTERLSVMDGADFINDDGTKKALRVRQNDILPYVKGFKYLDDIINGLESYLPIDYFKSCPFLLSFMGNYQIKKELVKYFSDHPKELEKLLNENKDVVKLLWLDTDDIHSYKDLGECNARLESLKKELFEDNNSHMMLWIPPSLPYYELKGEYKGSQHFSKILLFSSWEMVPKMISTLISYEAERRTIGMMKRKKSIQYFTNSQGNDRLPYSRLKDERRYYLLYPSEWLANLYNPISSLNAGETLEQICHNIRIQIEEELERSELLNSLVEDKQKNEDNRWYLLAPMIFDGNKHVQKWIDCFDKFNGKILLVDMLNKFKNDRDSLFDLTNTNYLKELKLGPQPKNLAEVLTQMAVGSPVNCIYRTNGKSVERAVKLSEVFINRFDTPEAVAIISLASLENPYQKEEDEKNSEKDESKNSAMDDNKKDDKQAEKHWIRLLNYCADGCFQAMFDEYYHMIADEISFSSGTDSEAVHEAVHRKMFENKTGTLNFRTRTYPIETPEKLKENVAKEIQRKELEAAKREAAQNSSDNISLSDKDKEDNEQINQEEETNHEQAQNSNDNKNNQVKQESSNSTTLRGHFAVCFTKGNSEEENDSKEAVQDAFNSPLRPFVLASTSIGQEGLDFHYYCRRIMHWNLPSNAVDLEQREGRINRYKCLSIRQSLAQYYTDPKAQFTPGESEGDNRKSQYPDIWKEIFEKATKPGESDNTKCQSQEFLQSENESKARSELTPYWCLGENQIVKIDRLVPMYPMSKDQERYNRLIHILSLYRLTMGQARQEELIEHLLRAKIDESELKSLFINLSPFDHKDDSEQ